MKTRNRRPRPVRQARKMKLLKVVITREADRKVRELARDFGTTPHVVLGLTLYFELSRRAREKAKE